MEKRSRGVARGQKRLEAEIKGGWGGGRESRVKQGLCTSSSLPNFHWYSHKCMQQK